MWKPVAERFFKYGTGFFVHGVYGFSIAMIRIGHLHLSVRSVSMGKILLMHVNTGWWFQIFVMFTLTWGDDPI